MANFIYDGSDEKEPAEPILEKYFPLKRLNLINKETLDKHITDLKLPVDYNFMDPKCLVGIEVEVEKVTRVDPNTTLFLWQMREDGSLRNSGREFVTPPIPAFYTYGALSLLFNGLNSGHEFSKRTSIHVHVNMRNLNASQILGTTIIYHSVEALLFDFVGGNRTNNIFCVPWTNSDFLSQKLSGRDKWRVLLELRATSEKYSALNLLPLENFGTLEFRHMPGTSDVKKIVRWVDMITAMRLYAVKHDFNRIVEEIISLNTNSQYEKYLENVFGSDLKALFNTSTLHQIMERNVLDIKNSLLTTQFHNKKMAVQTENLYSSSLANLFRKIGMNVVPGGATSKKPKKSPDDNIVFQQQLNAMVQDMAVAAPNQGARLGWPGVIANGGEIDQAAQEARDVNPRPAIDGFAQGFNVRADEFVAIEPQNMRPEGQAARGPGRLVPGRNGPGRGQRRNPIVVDELLDNRLVEGQVQVFVENNPPPEDNEGP